MDRSRPQASSDGEAGANLGERGDSLRDRRQFQRGAQGALQAGHAALGKLHVRPGQSDLDWVKNTRNCSGST